MPSINGNYIIDLSKSESCARFSQRLVGASSKDFRDIYQVKNISFGEFLDINGTGWDSVISLLGPGSLVGELRSWKL